MQIYTDNVAEHPNAFKVVREIVPAAWQADFSHALWQKGVMLESVEAVPSHMSLIGRGEIGGALDKAQILGRFATDRAAETIDAELGAGFIIEHEVEIMKVVVRDYSTKQGRKPFLALIIDAPQFYRERIDGIHIIEDIAQTRLDWRPVPNVSLKLAQLIPGTNVSSKARKALRNTLPDSVVIGQGSVIRNDAP